MPMWVCGVRRVSGIHLALTPPGAPTLRVIGPPVRALLPELRARKGRGQLLPHLTWCQAADSDVASGLSTA
eukprot:1056920-Heterocapsa_arctica.AAC.1